MITDSDCVLIVRYQDHLTMPASQLEWLDLVLDRPLQHACQPSLDEQIEQASPEDLRNYFAHRIPQRDHWCRVLPHEVADKTYQRYRFVFDALGYPALTVLADGSI